MTSVEWIEGYLKRFNHVTESLSLTKAFEKAKKMETEQKIAFAEKYANSDSIYCNGEFAIEKSAEQYYQETFKSK